MLEKEFQHYVTAQPELVKKYDGRQLVIVGEDVVGLLIRGMRLLILSMAGIRQGRF